MKRLIIVCVFIFCSVGLLAQQKGGITITRDTINISGYVYNYDGTPCDGAIIQSRQKDTVYNLTNMSTMSDKNGYFKLNGIKFNDTLYIAHQSHIVIYNKGSRYINVSLPIYLPAAPNKINGSIEVNAQRVNPKLPFRFIVKPYVRGNMIYGDTEKEPTYWRGPDNYKNDVLSKLIYPQAAIENNIEGEVQIGFTVLKDGNVGKYKVLRGLGYGCEDEVIQIMKTLRKWTPGIENGRPAEKNYTIDIEFKLTDN